MGVCLGVAGGNLCWARAVSFLFRFGPTQFRFCWGFACVLLLGFPAGLSQLFVRAVVTGKFFVGLARQIVCVLRWARAAFCWSSAFGVFFWALACCFLFERWRQEKRFVELARLFLFIWLCLACAIICLAFAASGLSSGREMFLFVGLVGIFCLAFAVLCLNGGRGEILLSSLHQNMIAFFFRDGLAQFYVRVGLSRLPGGLWQSFVGAVVKGNYFVELTRQILWLGVELAQFFVLLSALPVGL
jgi:hypothetical protein